MRKSGFRTHGFGLVFRGHFPVVDAADHVVIIFPRLAERLDQFQLGQLEQICARADAVFQQIFFRHLSDAVELADRQFTQDFRCTLGRDHGQAVRLLIIRGDLGEKKIVGNAGRSGQAGGLHDPSFDLPRGPRGIRDAAFVERHIQIRLVDRDRLDQVGVIEEDLPDLPGNRNVFFEIRMQEDRLRTKPVSGGRSHAGMDAELACLVGTGGHHSAGIGLSAHDDRFAPQRGIVPDLHRGEKSIHIDVNDLPHGNAGNQPRT